MKLEMTRKNIIFVVCGGSIVLILLLLILFGGKNNDNTKLLNRSKEIVKDVFYDEGNLEFNEDLKPTDNYCNGIRKTVSLNKKK